jgi:hypothetical protein
VSPDEQQFAVVAAPDDRSFAGTKKNRVFFSFLATLNAC